MSHHWGFAGLAFLLGTAAASAADAPAYHVVKSVALGAPDRWDYVVFDAASGRVYVSHGDRVSVLDGRSGAVLGAVEGMPGGTHGIGISTATGKGYTDDGKKGEAVAFDLKSFKTGARIPAKDDADGIAFDPVSGHVFVVDGDSAALTVIDPKTDKAIATIETGGGMEYAVSGDNGKLYVNGADKREIVRIDTATNKVDARWPVPGCESPHGLAIDKTAHRLFPTCLNAVMNVVDTDSGKVVASLPIGQGTDGAAFDPTRKLIFSANYDGTLTVIHEQDPDHYVPAGSIKTGISGKNMDIDPATGRLYVMMADVDPSAPVPPAKNGRMARRTLLPGTVHLLFLDPN
ncbi:MAG TPA: YncE family protein [Rhizomicrobium sp.]|nr:YncE family protein [Rhizomicrobium sp.]